MSQKKAISLNGVVEEQKARLGASGTKIAELKNRRDEASTSTVACRKELL